MSSYPTLDRFDFPVALAVSSASEVVSFDGDVEEVHPWKSVTKPLAALAVLVAVDQGRVGLDDPAGPEGSTVRHLLAHASGLPFEAGAVLQRPGLRRVYSNQGFEVLADHVAAAVDVPFPEWTRTAVLEPLELTSVTFDGSPAHAASGSAHDVLALGLEMLTPTLISADLGETARTVAFPGLSGVLPGFGRQDHNDWGLGPGRRVPRRPLVPVRGARRAVAAAERGDPCRAPGLTAGDRCVSRPGSARPHRRRSCPRAARSGRCRPQPRAVQARRRRTPASRRP
jgi:hypothetical protein